MDVLLGPLLWHWENNATNEPSIELSLSEVKTLARKIGFEISVSIAVMACLISPTIISERADD